MSQPTAPPPPRSSVARDLLGVALVLLGVAGLVTAAFLAHPVIGLAALSAAAVTLGFVIGTSEV